MTSVNTTQRNEANGSAPLKGVDYLLKEQVSIEVPDLQSPVIRVKDAHRYIGVSKSTYQNFKSSKSRYFKEDFPATVSIGDNAKGHYLADIDAWLHSRNLRSNFKRAGGAK